MPPALRRWGARQLLLAWVVYWTVLAAVVFARPAWLIWQLARDPHSHGNASASFSNTDLSLTVTADGVARWTGSASLLVLMLWLAVPPLVLAALWLRARPAQGARPPALPAVGDVARTPPGTMESLRAGESAAGSAPPNSGAGRSRATVNRGPPTAQ